MDAAHIRRWVTRRRTGALWPRNRSEQPRRSVCSSRNKENALYRSDDGGFTYNKVNDKDQVSNRPFYYNDLFVDPANENRVYHLASIVQVSDDGGRNFKRIMNDVHPDHHAWWIDPNNPHLIYNGNDGGMAISRDRGKSWRFPENLPLAQFYHIRVDNSVPYRICGGLQDNGSWCGPSQVWRTGGIRNSYWEEVAFGDGFDVVIHPEDLNTGYAMYQGGNLRRFDMVTGLQKTSNPSTLKVQYSALTGTLLSPKTPSTLTRSITEASLFTKAQIEATPGK